MICLDKGKDAPSSCEKKRVHNWRMHSALQEGICDKLEREWMVKKIGGGWLSLMIIPLDHSLGLR